MTMVACKFNLHHLHYNGIEKLVWLLRFLAIFSAAQADTVPLPAVTLGNDLFSNQLYDAIRKNSNENLVVSPLSLSTAVAMLQVGAREETATAIRSAFHFPGDDDLNMGYQSLLRALRSGGNITLEMVNRIYPAEGYKLNPEFVDTLAKYYSAEPHQLNYLKSAEAAAEINSFVKKSTHGKIHDLISPKDLNAQTRLVVVNAIYFKGSWKHPFPKKDTTKMDFYTDETATVKVDMMKLETDMLYTESVEMNCQVVALPYHGGRWSMMVLLPNKRSGLSEMEDKFKYIPLDKLVRSMRSRKIQLFLPKFRLESTIDLEKPLTELGVGVIFDPVKANFSGIPAEPLKTAENLFVSKAVQKAFVEVSEEGTEAAAATALVMMGRAMMPHREAIPVVRVDHPFFSMVVHGDMKGANSGFLNSVFVQRMTHV